MLRVLLKLLETSRESRTLAVAASDLGRFIAAHPHGRNIVAGAPVHAPRARATGAARLRARACAAPCAGDATELLSASA